MSTYLETYSIYWTNIKVCKNMTQSLEYRQNVVFVIVYAIHK